MAYTHLMDRKRLFYGVADPVTIIGVLFLLITLGVGRYVITNKEIDFNISERAGKWDSLPDEEFDEPTNSNTSNNTQFNWNNDYITDTDEEEFIEETQGDPFNQLNNNPPPAEPVVEDPVVAPPVIVTPPVTTTPSGSCVGKTQNYEYGTIVVYAGEGSYKKCGTLPNGQIGWVDCPTTDPECRLTNATNVATYLQELQQQDRQQQEQETEAQAEVKFQNEAQNGITSDEINVITQTSNQLQPFPITNTGQVKVNPITASQPQTAVTQQNATQQTNQHINDLFNDFMGSYVPGWNEITDSDNVEGFLNNQVSNNEMNSRSFEPGIIQSTETDKFIQNSIINLGSYNPTFEIVKNLFLALPDFSNISLTPTGDKKAQYPFLENLFDFFNDIVN